MVCYNIYIYNRQGTCVYYFEWLRTKPVEDGAGTRLDDQKQLFGLFWTLSNFCAALDPKDANKGPLGTPRRISQGCRFRSFTTNNYKLHFFEALTGIKIVLNTSSSVSKDLSEVLQVIYEKIFAEYVIKHPLYVSGHPFYPPQFEEELNKYLAKEGLLA
mmetsp:Transcript_13267/g.23498  ORF Transcript_13267/g.23498 Transcript_13267/m.23498 type:complete len:159 (-) Transcript_13267:148-624(-)